MAGIEDALPPQYQFESNLTELRDLLTDEIDEAISAGDIIVPKVELDGPFLQLWEMSAAIAQLAKLESEDIEEVTAVLYRGFTVGVQLASQLSSGSTATISLKYLRDHQDNPEVMDTIHEDVQVYLGNRPALDSLIMLYSNEIDPQHRYGHHVETATGFMLLLAEQHLAEQYVDQMFGSLQTPHLTEGNPE